MITVYIDTVWGRIKRNPVLVGAAVLWAQDVLSNGDPLTWRTLLTVGVGVLVRSRVVPVDEAQSALDEADAFIGELSHGLHEALTAAAKDS